jgi:hypothetical protein
MKTSFISVVVQLLQPGCNFQGRVARIIERNDVSRAFPNRDVPHVTAGIGKSQVLPGSSFLAASEKANCIVRRFLRDYFELIRSTHGSAYVDYAAAGLFTIGRVTIDRRLRLG